MIYACRVKAEEGKGAIGTYVQRDVLWMSSQDMLCGCLLKKTANQIHHVQQFCFSQDSKQELKAAAISALPQVICNVRS